MKIIFCSKFYFAFLRIMIVQITETEAKLIRRLLDNYLHKLKSKNINNACFTLGKKVQRKEITT
jgi:hypothetical protein